MAEEPTDEELLEQLERSREEFVDAYRELNEDMAMVLRRVPSIAENPGYIEERAKLDAMALGLLDRDDAIREALAEE